MDFRPIVLVSGTLLAALAVMMCIPAIVDFVDGHPDWEIFGICASLTLFVGVGMALTSRSDGSKLNIRQAFVMTTLSWVFLSIFASLNFLMGVGWIMKPIIPSHFVDLSTAQKKALDMITISVQSLCFCHPACSVQY